MPGAENIDGKKKKIETGTILKVCFVMVLLLR
jgi:hypothetical protein